MIVILSQIVDLCYKQIEIDVELDDNNDDDDVVDGQCLL